MASTCLVVPCAVETDAAGAADEAGAAPEAGAEDPTWGAASSRVQSVWTSSAGQVFQSRSASFRRSPTLRSRLATSTRATGLGLAMVWAAACEVGLPVSAMRTTTARPIAETAATASTTMRTAFI